MDHKVERFSSDHCETNTKIITLTNHNSSKQRDEPIRIPKKSLISHARWDTFWSCFLLAEKLAQDFKVNPLSEAIAIVYYFQLAFQDYFLETSQQRNRDKLIRNPQQKHNQAFMSQKLSY